MNRNPLLALLAVLLLCSQAVQVQAASLYMDPAFSSLGRGDGMTISVRLDTDEAADECVNAVDAVIKYSENIYLADVSTGDSIFSMWVEQPKIDAANHTITFAGGIPNGYCGRIQGDPRLTNTIAKLVFRSPGNVIGQGTAATNTAKIEFAPETTAYLNDGLGTKAELALFGASIDLSKNPSTELKDPWRDAVVTDEIAPEPFSIELFKDDYAFNAKYFISFNTSDKQTGIDQYQVMEEPISKFWSFDWGRADAPWIVARSPYELEDQSLNSIIRVKAIDKAGNEHIATLVPDEAMRTVPTSMIVLVAVFAFAGLVLLTLVAVGVRALVRRRATLKEQGDEVVAPNETT
ncbi:MAG: hypothetical protein RLZZ480_83 [Candidatus Parcubacteria bacterium]|jgi:hypothetical protein